MSARGFAPRPLVMMMHGPGKAVQEFNANAANCGAAGQSLARFLIQMGVPTNPKARRIWFSKNR